MKKRDLLLNSIVPLLFGVAIYYILAPEVYFVRAADRVLDVERQKNFWGDLEPWLRGLRYWGPDMLWSYSLLFSLHLVTDNKAVSAGKLFCVAFLFSLALELVQYFFETGGTFDVRDIVAEWTALVIAAVIIKYSTMRRKKDEST